MDEPSRQSCAIVWKIKIIVTSHSIKDDSKENDDELPARSPERSEEDEVLRSAKDVSMHLLPTRVLPNHSRTFHIEFLVLSVSCKVIAKGTQENESHESTQENDHHETVEDAKPVDLVLEEIIFQVAIEASLERFGGRFPMHRIGVTKGSSSFQGDGVL